MTCFALLVGLSEYSCPSVAWTLPSCMIEAPARRIMLDCAPTRQSFGLTRGLPSPRSRHVEAKVSKSGVECDSINHCNLFPSCYCGLVPCLSLHHNHAIVLFPVHHQFHHHLHQRCISPAQAAPLFRHSL